MRPGPRKCIFCGAGKLTAEHFWPEWAASILPNGRDPSYYDFAQNHDPRTGEIRRTRHYRRQGLVTTKRLRVVCGPCNNGWMSRLETATKPILTPMAIGEDTRLTEADQRTLSAWVALKLMVAEHNIIPEVVTPQEDLTALMLDGAPPNSLHIWLFRCGEGVWQSRYQRHAAHLTTLPLQRQDVLRKNTQSITFGFAQVLFYCFYTRGPGVAIETGFNERLARKLWPIGGEIEWPPERIDATGAENVASTFVRFMASNVHFADSV